MSRYLLSTGEARLVTQESGSYLILSAEPTASGRIRVSANRAGRSRIVIATGTSYGVIAMAAGTPYGIIRISEGS